MTDQPTQPGEVEAPAATTRVACTPELQCTNCGAGLGGLAGLGMCAECGTSQPGAAFVPIDHDCSCRDCGYALRGLLPTGVCPECGKPVWQSLRGDYLRYASVQYIAKVRSGLNWFLNGVLLLIALPFLIVLFGLFSSVGQRSGVSASVVSAFVTLSLLIPWCLMAWGMFKYTTADPSYAGSVDPGATRRVIRIALFAGVGAFVANFVLNSMFVFVGWIRVTMSVVGLAIAVTLIISMLVYTKWMLMRVPDRSKAYLAKTYTWLLPLLLVGSVVFAVSGGMAFRWTGCFGALFVLGSWVVSLALFWNLHHYLLRHLRSIETRKAPSAGNSSYS